MKRAIELAEASPSAFSAIILTCDHQHTRVQERMVPAFQSRWLDLDLSRDALSRPFVPNQKAAGGCNLSMEGALTATGDVTARNDNTLTWECVRWVKELTNLPVVVKGVLCVADARLAIEAGAAAVVVSNHGGRQLDGTPPAIEVLPAIVAAVGDRIPVFIDSGVRKSTDILKALCLGAKGVLLGRPPLWGLACGGAAGLETMLKQLQLDLQSDMQSLGVTSLEKLGPHMIYPPDRQRIDALTKLLSDSEHCLGSSLALGAGK